MTTSNEMTAANASNSIGEAVDATSKEQLASASVPSVAQRPTPVAVEEHSQLTPPTTAGEQQPVKSTTRASVDGDDLNEQEATAVPVMSPLGTSISTSSNNNHDDNDDNHHHHHNSVGKGVFPLWTNITGKMHEQIINFNVTMSVNAARRPYTVIGTVLFLSFALVGIGFFTNFNINVEETEIYAPFNSVPQEHMHWRDNEAGFLEATRVTTMVIHADGANVLGYEAMKRVFTALDTVRNITGYHDICEDGDYYDERKDEFTCRIIAATRFWYHDTQLFYNTTHNDADLIATLSQTEYPPGIPADHEYVLGKLEREPTEYGNGTITYVPAYYVYVLLSNKEQTEEFEIEIIEKLSALQREWDVEENNVLQLEFFAERSFSDEFTRAIEEDMFLIPMIFVMMSGFTCVVFFQTDRVQSRSGLGVGSVTAIGMSLMSGFGIMFICGVPFTSMTQILPFVVFGVGLDDTFIITGEYFRTDASLDIVERVRLTMQEVGPAITTTTVTTMFAFMLGLTSSVPAIYWLCLYAFPTIGIVFLYQITFFWAIVVIDERRIKANREDIFVCFVRHDIDVDKFPTTGRGGMNDKVEEDESIMPAPSGIDYVEQQQPERHIADRIMAWYANQLMRPLVKGIVIVIFTYFFALCAYRTTLLTQEFDVTELFPDGSYCTDVLDAIQVYQERSLQVEIYFRDIDQSDPDVQEQMLQFVDEITELPPFGQPPPLCWVRDFRMLQETEYYEGAEYMTFEQQVQYALSIPAINEAYGLDIVHENGNITASRCIIIMKNEYLDEVDKQISVLTDQRAVTIAQPINNDGRSREAFFTFNQVYLLWEFYNVAVSELITTTVSSVIAVSIVALVFVPHWTALLYIVPMVSVVYIDLLGTMQVAGLHINAVTYVCLVISIGLIVDFLMHILLRYHESKYRTREGRVKDTLETMGASILLGGLSTFLGVMPLAFSTSTILRTVFTSLFSMVILGITHGLILLPVILSVVGPQADTRETTSSRSEAGDDRLISKEIGYTFDSASSDGSPKSASSYQA